MRSAVTAVFLTSTKSLDKAQMAALIERHWDDIVIEIGTQSGPALAFEGFEDPFSSHLHECGDLCSDLADHAPSAAGDDFDNHVCELIGSVGAQLVATDQRCNSR